MSKYDASQDRDANFQVIGDNDSFKLSSTWTFAAATTGAVGAHTVFTVTGDVLMRVFAVCSTNVAGSGTAEVGVTGNTAALIAQTTGTDIDAGKIWIDATPEVGTAALPSTFIVTNGLDVILTIASDTLTGGVVTFYCMYRPLSSTGAVTVTTPA